MFFCLTFVTLLDVFVADEYIDSCRFTSCRKEVTQDNANYCATRVYFPL